MHQPHYHARVLEAIKNRPGTWNSYRIGVYERELLIGTYVRNYSLLDTFFPFCAGERWYALYSPDYTATRLMSLPDCTDLGGEEPDSWGFCPTEFFVPSYVEIQYHGVSRPTRIHIRGAADLRSVERTVRRGRARLVTPETFYPFGFVAGCVWGDDSSWKIQHLDLSHAADGVIVREERFGYIELPGPMRLRDAITIHQLPHIHIATERTFNLETGATDT